MVWIKYGFCEVGRYRLNGKSQSGIDHIYPEFGLSSKVITDKPWKLDRLTCRSLFVEWLHSSTVFLFSGGWRSLFCRVWGSEWNRLCHFQLHGYWYLPNRGKGKEPVKDRTGGFHKPVLDGGFFTSTHILWLELEDKAKSTWKGHWET